MRASIDENRGLRQHLAERTLPVVDRTVAFEAAQVFQSRPSNDRPRLIVIHATRSGRRENPPDQELQGTLRWFLDSRSRPDSRTWASAHDVIAVDGTRHACVPPDLMAWHAGYLNPVSIGIEVVQPTWDTPFREEQLASTAARARELCQAYGIPMVRVMSEQQSGIIGHEDAEQGRVLGKSDPGDKARGGQWDWDAFIALVWKEVGTVEPKTELDPETRKAILAYLDTAWGKTEETERLQREVRDYLMLIKRELGLELASGRSEPSPHL